MDNRQTENLRAIFDETLNQFNYSSDLFDSLESKVNFILVSIGIILAISLNLYLLNKIESSFLIVKLIYYCGISLTALSFILMFRLKKYEFKTINITTLKESFIKSPNKNFKKIIIGKYVPEIKKNSEHYRNKKEELKKALIIMKTGMFILFSVIFYILILASID